VVERAYVRWCGVVGGWFVGDSGSVKHKRSRSVVDFTTPAGLESEGGVVSTKTPSISPLKRVGTWRRSLPTITSLGEAGASVYAYGSGSLRRRGREQEKAAEELEESDGIPPTVSSQSLAPRPSKVRRKPAVRDLAILPTQRVMRYVLLYRGALSFVFTSEASVLILACPYRPSLTHPTHLVLTRHRGASSGGCLYDRGEM